VLPVSDREAVPELSPVVAPSDPGTTPFHSPTPQGSQILPPEWADRRLRPEGPADPSPGQRPWDYVLPVGDREAVPELSPVVAPATPG